MRLNRLSLEKNCIEKNVTERPMIGVEDVGSRFQVFTATGDGAGAENLSSEHNDQGSSGDSHASDPSDLPRGQGGSWKLLKHRKPETLNHKARYLDELRP